MSAKYRNGQREDIITRFAAGEPVSVLTKTTGIPRSTIYAWIKKDRDNTKHKRYS